MDELPLIADKSIRAFLDKYEKIPECSAREHPYPGKVFAGYYPGRNVFMQCTNCNGFYQRPPTEGEIEAYQKMLKLEARVLHLV